MIFQLILSLLRVCIQSLKINYYFYRIRTFGSTSVSIGRSVPTTKTISKHETTPILQLRALVDFPRSVGYYFRYFRQSSRTCNAPNIKIKLVLFLFIYFLHFSSVTYCALRWRPHIVYKVRSIIQQQK